MFRRSCKYQTLLCQFCYNPLQLKVLGICYSLQSCPAAMIYCETLLLNLYIIPFMTRKGQKSSIISVAIYILLYIVTYFTVPIPHLLKKLASHVLQNMFVITCTSLQFAPVSHIDPELCSQNLSKNTVELRTSWSVLPYFLIQFPQQKSVYQVKN